MRDQSPTLALRDAFASLPPALSAQAKEQLRNKVEKFVDLAKAKDWPIERVIVAIKQVAAEAGVRSSTDVLRTNSHLEVRDALLLDVVRWCVERYYGYSRTPTRRGGAPDGKKHGSSGKGGDLRSGRGPRVWMRKRRAKRELAPGRGVSRRV